MQASWQDQWSYHFEKIQGFFCQSLEKSKAFINSIQSII